MKRLIAMAAICLSTQAQAGFRTGNELMKDCRGTSYQDKAFCSAYITGVTDANISWNNLKLPDGVTVGQLVDIVTKYLEKHPEIRHIPADMLTLMAITESFPGSWKPKE